MTGTLTFKRYPGRFMLIGKDGDASVAIYGATGRSPSSLARKFINTGNAVYMTASDATVAIQGNPDLLEYPALQVFENGIVIANGNHINRIENLAARDARQQLSYALSEEAYEPDEYRTPRITGCIVEYGGKVEGALHIVRSASDGIDHSSWSVDLQEGNAHFISTYIGDDVVPTPSFKGDPIAMKMSFGSASKASRAVFDALSPQEGEADYRVGVIAAYWKHGSEPDISVVNRLS